MRFCIEERNQNICVEFQQQQLMGIYLGLCKSKQRLSKQKSLKKTKRQQTTLLSLLHFLPDPCSAMWIVIPFVLMKRCVISSIFGGHFECLRNTERERERERERDLLFIQKETSCRFRFQENTLRCFSVVNSTCRTFLNWTTHNFLQNLLTYHWNPKPKLEAPES